MTVEERLTDAFRAADQYQPSPDLFAKVTRSIEEDASHRRRVRSMAISVVAALGFIAAYLFIAVDRVDGAFEMPFWTFGVSGSPSKETCSVRALPPAAGSLR
jgi:hypothetical protein